MFLSPGAVPARWRDRAIQISFVPLSPSEAANLLGQGMAEARIDRSDEALARLAARGLTARAISLELGMSLRTVYRGLARLRERFGAASREELVARLAERGFGR